MTVVTPSVLNVIHGQVVPMDLVKVQTEKECFFSFLSIGWGLMADIDIESERLRAIGEARFAVWGVIRALGKSSIIQLITLIMYIIVFICVLLIFMSVTKMYISMFSLNLLKVAVALFKIENLENFTFKSTQT